MLSNPEGKLNDRAISFHGRRVASPALICVFAREMNSMFVPPGDDEVGMVP